MIGVVAIGRHVVSRKIAVLKCMSWQKIKEKNLIKNIMTEVDLHYLMSPHPHILPLKQLLMREKECVMIFPYIVGRDLYKFMRSRKSPRGHLTEYQSLRVFSQLLSAIGACHKNRIIHRDIKPENIMIDEDFNILLGDFGLAIKLEGNSHKGRAGTPCYYPYEMVNNLEYDQRADFWCMGVLLCEMLLGVLPFKQNPKTKDYVESITKLQYTLPSNNNVSKEAYDLIKCLLVK
jgi:serine/threonine protein kinase